MFIQTSNETRELEACEENEIIGKPSFHNIQKLHIDEARTDEFSGWGGGIRACAEVLLVYGSRTAIRPAVG